MRLAYVGNFEPDHSTENHVRWAFEANGDTIDPVQESDTRAWRRLVTSDLRRFDAVLWTHTQFDPGPPHELQRALLNAASDAGVPTVGYHLDRWWGLAREHLVGEEPFFECDVVCTADGGHDAEWARAGVRHRWVPPAVLGAEAQGRARPHRRYTADVCFVGSWQDYHPEWRYRVELVAWLRERYGERIAVWPRLGEHAVRGQALRDLYASVKVVVGDSCLAGGQTHYWSDRVPETLGRGAFLVHPYVDGMAGHFVDGEHYVSYPIGEFDVLAETIDHYVADDTARARIAAQGRAHVLENHTYEVRARDLASMIKEQLA